MPDGINQSHYFISYSYGTAPVTPWVFSMDLFLEKGDPRLDHLEAGGLLDVALGSHYLTIDDKGNRVTPELNDYMLSMPGWTIPIGWVATYDSWVV